MSGPFPDPQVEVKRQRIQARDSNPMFHSSEMGSGTSFLSLALEGVKKQGPPQQSGSTHRDTSCYDPPPLAEVSRGGTFCRSCSAPGQTAKLPGTLPTCAHWKCVMALVRKPVRLCGRGSLMPTLEPARLLCFSWLSAALPPC